MRTDSAWKFGVQKDLIGWSQECLCKWWRVQLVRSKNCLRVNWYRQFKITSIFGQGLWKEIVKAGGYRLSSSAEQWGHRSPVHPLIYLSFILINFQSETDCVWDSCGQASCVGCLRKELSREQLSPIINLQGKGCFSAVPVGTSEGDWLAAESTVLSRNNWSQENPS